MVSGSEADDTGFDAVQQAIGPLVSALSRAVFSVCTVAIGTLTLLLAAGENTAESSAVFGILGVAALVVGFVMIGRLPTPHEESSSTDSDSQPSDDHSEPTDDDSGTKSAE